MALFSRVASRAVPSRTWTAADTRLSGASNFGRLRRGFSSFPNPYTTLDLNRNASEDEIKKAYKDKALKWHPDRNADGNVEEAQTRFSEAANAYEILKDPEKRKEFDVTGQVGGGAQGPNGFQGGFHGRPVNQAEAERLFREAFGGFGGGGQGMDMQAILMQQMMMQQQQERMHAQRQQHGCGGGGPPQRKPGELVADMEVRINPNEDSIHRASRASSIDEDYDTRRAQFAGKVGTITKIDVADRSIKLRVMVSPGRAAELWYGAGAVWDPSVLEEGLEVLVSPDVAIIHSASREVGIDEDNDERRARCADEVWFGIGAFEPRSQQAAPQPQARGHPRAADMNGFNQAF